MASVGLDATARLWDTATGRLLLLTRSDAAIMRAAFSPDARLLATGGWDRRVHLVEIDPERFLPASPQQLRGWIESLTTATVTAEGSVVSRAP